MSPTNSAIIDFTEAAYDLELSDEEWLPTVLERGLPVLDHGLGVAGIEYGRPPEGGEVAILRIHVASGPADFPARHMAALAATPPEDLREQSRPGQAATMSTTTRAHPEALERYTSHVDYCKDVLGITTVDCRGAGAAIVAPLAQVTTLAGQNARRWQMLAAHFDAGHRLRQGLATKEANGEPFGNLPYDAEAILDPRTFRLEDAVGEAKDRSVAKKLRDRAVALDRARGKMRESDPEKALAAWKALVWGRWSLVDWFDTDGRRYVLAVPNAPHVTDPRGLTQRENQVVACAMRGDSNKMISYRLGLSSSQVSRLMRSAMKKLGFRTRAQLVKTVRELQSLH
jgi:DNA-binding CsgD family transcriptional regulator